MDGSTTDTAVAAAERPPLADHFGCVLLEVAPGPSLASLARACFRSSFTWLGLRLGLGLGLELGLGLVKVEPSRRGVDSWL